MSRPRTASYWIGPLLLAGIIAVAPLLATYDPIKAETERELEGPSTDHWLGTDRLGRDEWSRLIVGAQRTLGSVFVATLIAVSGGLVLGGLNTAGPRGLRNLSSAFTNALLAFPALLTALVVRTLLEGSLLTLAIAIGAAGIAPYARVATDALWAAHQQPHIEGAHSIGAGRWRILTRHVMPSALPTLASFASVTFAWSLLYGAALAALGLGGEPSQPDWGIMIAQAQGTLSQAPQLLLFPGGGLVLTVWLAHRFADQLARPIGR